MKTKLKIHTFFVICSIALILIYNSDKFPSSYGLSAKERIARRVEQHFKISEESDTKIFGHFLNHVSSSIATQEKKPVDIGSLLPKHEPLFLALQKAVVLLTDLKCFPTYMHLNKNPFFLQNAATTLSESAIITSSEEYLTALTAQLIALHEELNTIEPTTAENIKETLKEFLLTIAYKTMILSIMESSKVVVKEQLEILRNDDVDEVLVKESLEMIKQKMELITKCLTWLSILSNKIKAVLEKAQRICSVFELESQLDIAKIYLKIYTWFYLNSINVFWECDANVDGVLLLGPSTNRMDHVYRFKKEDGNSFSLQKEQYTHEETTEENYFFLGFLKRVAKLFSPLVYIKNFFFEPSEATEDEPTEDPDEVFEMMLNDVKVLSKVLSIGELPIVQSQTTWNSFGQLKDQELQKTDWGIFCLLRNVFGDEVDTSLDFVVEAEEEELEEKNFEPADHIPEQLYREEIQSALTMLPEIIVNLYDNLKLPKGIQTSTLSFVQSVPSCHMIYFENCYIVDDYDDVEEIFIKNYDLQLFKKALLEQEPGLFVRTVMKFLVTHFGKASLTLKALKKKKKTILVDVLEKLATYNLLLDIQEGKELQNPLMKTLTNPFMKKEVVEKPKFSSMYQWLSFIKREDLALNLAIVEFFSTLYVLFVKLKEARQREHSKKDRKESQNVLLFLDVFFKPGYMNTLQNRIQLIKKINLIIKKNNLRIQPIALNYAETAGRPLEQLTHLVFGMIYQQGAPATFMIRKCIFKNEDEETQIKVNLNQIFQDKKDIIIETSNLPLLVFFKAMIEIYHDELNPKQIKLLFSNTQTREDLENIVTAVFSSKFGETVSTTKKKSGKKK